MHRTGDFFILQGVANSFAHLPFTSCRIGLSYTAANCTKNKNAIELTIHNKPFFSEINSIQGQSL